MSNEFNVVKFYEVFARIIAEREGVEITVTVRRKEEADAENHIHVPDVRQRVPAVCESRWEAS